MIYVAFYRKFNMVYGLLQCMMEVVFYRRVNMVNGLLL